MAKQRQLACFLDERIGNPFKEDVMVSVTIHDVPSRLLKEFMKKVVWERYEGGISPAIRDLMWLAVEKRKEKQAELNAFSKKVKESAP